ncbi:hypothetical protein ACPCIZ_22790 [Streptomyces cellulosae]
MSKPWYMDNPDALNVDKGSPDANRRYLESIAAAASTDADAHAAHLRQMEAQGVKISPTTRLAMGYASNARKAAALLDAAGPAPQETTASDDDVDPLTRMSRAYGGN